ncbi:hypothetical protein K458DRAFT_471110 [Lentithecium fluviatile CBS 122367]|uniref:Uncharacterized protein n=1 Tax=Lentithecium fluviatile CBS 122367 TaxID=1168545 RepID=A0A6G1ICG9_9PLEO|nr:hypothetical protein K458DRAFT_471110 [Lentithecium fluviatile CBS 122367]
MTIDLSVHLILKRDRPREHHSLFICTNETTQAGYLYQVSGYVNRDTGMYHQHYACPSPSQHPGFLTEWCLGWVDRDLYEAGEVRRVVDSVAAPAYRELPVEEAVESVEGAGDLDEEAIERLAREEEERNVEQDSQQWTCEVVNRLRVEGVLTLRKNFWASHQYYFMKMGEDSEEEGGRDAGGGNTDQKDEAEGTST